MKPRIHVGTRKGLFAFEKTNGHWCPAGEWFLGIHIPMLLHDRRDGLLHAAVEHGHFGTKMHRSADGGATWEETVGIVYPPKPDDVPEIRDSFRNVVVPWSLEKVWSLETGGPDQPGLLWCGTIPGGLFRSTDSGVTWELVRSLWDRPERADWGGGGYDFPGIHSICVDPRNSQRVAVAISCAGVWLTEDGGESWEQGADGMTYDFLPAEQGGADPGGQDPHRMVMCPAAPDRYWVQHHCSIYRSDGAGRGWQEIPGVKPSGFGFAVAVHPRDPDTAWFVPAKKDEFRYPVDGEFVVTRTRDGGKSFEVLSKGLPPAPCYDLVYRHGLDIDESGDCLVMGSTTGALWISEDQGDSWELLSAHLPPIYCVRFA
jgi:hypothetical protein